MKLTLNRKFKGQTYTIGDLSIDGKFSVIPSKMP